VRDLEFPMLRRTIADSHEKLEAALLKNYGVLLLQMLGCKMEGFLKKKLSVEFCNVLFMILLMNKVEED